MANEGLGSAILSWKNGNRHPGGDDCILGGGRSNVYIQKQLGSLLFISHGVWPFGRGSTPGIGHFK